MVAHGQCSLAYLCLAFSLCHPVHTVVLKPINDQLLDTGTQRSIAQTEKPLKQWSTKHWVCSITSGLSFVVYLWASIEA